MRRPSLWRLLASVLLGLVSASLAFILWSIVARGASIPGSELLGAFGALLLILWIFLASLTVLLVRRLHSATVIDAVVGATLAVAGIALLVARMDAYTKPVDAVTGEPCGDDGQRKVAPTMQSSPLGGRVIDGECVSREEFAARGLERMRIDFSACETPGRDRKSGPHIIILCGPMTVPATDESALISALNRLVANNAILDSFALGAIAGLVGWLCAFGWRWRVRSDEL